MKKIYIIHAMNFEDLSDLKVGDQYILISRTNINTNKTTYHLRPDNGEGISGNMDASIKRYHGWRGTTNNVSTYAEGLRRIERIDWIKTDFVDTAKVSLSADLLPDAE